jgi:hypothetical protein
MVSGFSPAAGQKNGRSNRGRNFLGLVPKSAVVGFRNNSGKNVGWIECNETQQSLECAQPNLPNAKWPRIEATPTFGM